MRSRARRLKHELDRQKSANLNKKKQNIFFDIENCSIEVRDKEKIIKLYSSSDAPTVTKFHHDNDSLHKLIMGPRGSSKSSGCCAEILFKTYKNPPCKDGVKRARWLIGRETYGELKTTTIKTFSNWFGHSILNWHLNQQPPIRATLSYFDGQYPTEIELLFVSFDNDIAAKKALSLDITGAYFNEASKISQTSMADSSGGLRYPSQDDIMDDQAIWRGIIYDSNAFEDYHPFYKKFYIDKPDKHSFYLQPGGMIEVESGVFEENPNSENIHHLPKDYYKNMSLGKTDAFIRTQICNQFGTYEDTKAVHPEFKREIHIRDTIELVPGHPIWLTHDFGGTNATLVCQYINGQLIAIKELLGVKESLTEFQRSTVKGWLRLNAPTFDVQKSIGDCADNYGHIAAQNSIETVTKCLEIQTFPAITNNIKARIDSVDDLIIKRLGNGEAGLKVSEEGCPILAAGLLGKYKLKLITQKGNSRIVEVPDKNEYSHSADCLQYAALEVKSIVRANNYDERVKLSIAAFNN